MNDASKLFDCLMNLHLPDDAADNMVALNLFPNFEPDEPFTWDISYEKMTDQGIISMELYEGKTKQELLDKIGFSNQSSSRPST